MLRNSVPVGLYGKEVSGRVTLRNLLQRRGYDDLEAVLAEGKAPGDRRGRAQGTSGVVARALCRVDLAGRSLRRRMLSLWVVNDNGRSATKNTGYGTIRRVVDGSLREEETWPWPAVKRACQATLPDADAGWDRFSKEFELLRRNTPI